MIERMKKYQFLIYHKDYQTFLLKLRELGVVHITQKQLGTISDDSELATQINLEKRFETIIKRLNEINKEQGIKETEPAHKHTNGVLLLETIETLFKEKDTLLIEQQNIQKEIERFTPWGAFSLNTINVLAKKGWYVHLFSITESKFNPQWIDDYNAIKINQAKSNIYFITITKSATPPVIEAEYTRMPEKSVTEWQFDLETIKNKYSELEIKLNQHAKNDIETLRYSEAKVKDSIDFSKIELSADTAAKEKLMILEGYVPARNEETVTNYLQTEDSYFEVSIPTPKDNVPVKLRNNKFTKAFELITNLYDQPNYNAFDLTPFFAPFYIVFFGLCLGDCGYGLLIFLASFFIKKKAKTDFMQSAGQLATYLGLGTMIFGFISGTFFGFSLTDIHWTWFEPLKTIILDEGQLFYLALICGAVQIIYALIIKAITTWIRFGFLYSLDTWGWLLTILGIASFYYIGNEGIISSDTQTLGYYLFVSIGAFMMLFFNNPSKGLKGIPGSIGSGLFGLYNKLSGLLGDMLSYIRLFALGISGSVMGMVFNQLSTGFAPDVPLLKELVMLIIFVFGHSINLALNGLGSFVHPLRLTFVEFYNNAGFEGGGKVYTPFKKHTD